MRIVRIGIVEVLINTFQLLISIFEVSIGTFDTFIQFSFFTRFGLFLVFLSCLDMF